MRISLLWMVMALALVACSGQDWMRESDRTSAACAIENYQSLMEHGGDPTINFALAGDGCPFPDLASSARQFESYSEYEECLEQAQGMYRRILDDSGYELMDLIEIRKLDRRYKTASVYHCWPVGGPEALPELPGAPGEDAR